MKALYARCPHNFYFFAVVFSREDSAHVRLCMNAPRPGRVSLFPFLSTGNLCAYSQRSPHEIDTHSTHVGKLAACSPSPSPVLALMEEREKKELFSSFQRKQARWGGNNTAKPRNNNLSLLCSYTYAATQSSFSHTALRAAGEGGGMNNLCAVIFRAPLFLE